jgi:hypothetical protein
MSVRTTSVNSGGETGLIKYFAAPALSGTVLADDDPRKNIRFLTTWLSHNDLVQLVKKSICSGNVKFGIYYGVSNNKGRFWDISNAEQELEFHPQDDASSLPMLSRQ